MSVRQIEAELVLDARATLGEGPSWDDERGELIWVDILEHAVHLYDPVRDRDRIFDAGQPVSAAVRRARGGLALAMRDGFAFLDPASGSVNLVVPVEADLAGNRMNDGKCDAGGRFIAGTMPSDGDRPTGALYRLDPDLGVTKLVDGVTISNGIGWSPDGRTMYYVDSPTHRVEAFDYDPQTGGISARRTLISLPEEWGLPDGMTTDEAGFLWVAFWEGSAVRRLAPTAGWMRSSSCRSRASRAAASAGAISRSSMSRPRRSASQTSRTPAASSAPAPASAGRGSTRLAGDYWSDEDLGELRQRTP